MLAASFSVAIDIDAPIEKVFAYVSDLTTHGEWAANPLKIETISSGAVRIGSRYRSTANSRGATFTAELVVTELQPPHRFAFSGQDGTGRFEHRFNLFSQDGGTRVERTVTMQLTTRQWLMFQVLLYTVRLPAARKALRSLKARLEQQT